MVRKAEKINKSHTKEEFIEWFESLNESDIDGASLAVYWEHLGKCMQCGCPKDNDLMKHLIDAYICNVCAKKKLGDELFQKRLDLFDKHHSDFGLRNQTSGDNHLLNGQ